MTSSRPQVSADQQDSVATVVRRWDPPFHDLAPTLPCRTFAPLVALLAGCASDGDVGGLRDSGARSDAAEDGGAHDGATPGAGDDAATEDGGGDAEDGAVKATHPAQVMDLSVVSSTERTVTLKWTQVDDGRGEPADYFYVAGEPL